MASFASFTDRMLRAAKLEPALFEEVERDTTATVQALGVVALAAVAVGIGAAFRGSAGVLVVSVLASIVGWALWAALVWLIGTKLLPEPQTRSNWSEIARTTGFAQSPGVLRILIFIPVIGPTIAFAVSVWMMVAMIIAVRQALDYRQTWRAVVVVAIGWVLNLLLFALTGSLH